MKNSPAVPGRAARQRTWSRRITVVSRCARASTAEATLDQRHLAGDDRLDDHRGAGR